MKKILFLLMAAGCGIMWAQTNAPDKTPAQPTLVNSDSADFDLNTRRAEYHGHVEVIDPKVKLTCDWLVVDLPAAGAHLSHVSAETNVVIDFLDEKGDKYHVTSDKAVYAYNLENAVTNETVTFTGSPKVVTADGTISCEPLIWDRAKGHFKFGGGYQMILNQNLNGGGGTNSLPVKLF